jgi:hypothetical protein
VVDRHGVEGQGAVEDEDVHQAGERPLVLQGAALEQDLAQRVENASGHAVEPVLGPSGPHDPVAEDEGPEEEDGGREDRQDEHDFFGSRKHRSLLGKV